jgi:hypothetical protein
VTEPHSNGSPETTRTASKPLDPNVRRSIKAARTTRLRRRFRPFDELDAEVTDLIRRLDPDPGESVGTNVARTILQAQTLRKEILLGKLKAEDLDARVDERDIRQEWETVKRELGIPS